MILETKKILEGQGGVPGQRQDNNSEELHDASSWVERHHKGGERKRSLSLGELPPYGVFSRYPRLYNPTGALDHLLGDVVHNRHHRNRTNSSCFTCKTHSLVSTPTTHGARWLDSSEFGSLHRKISRKLPPFFFLPPAAICTHLTRGRWTTGSRESPRGSRRSGSRTST